VIAASGRLTLDRLQPGAALQVIRLDDFSVAEADVREPHRHDYHELIWVLSGEGEHLIDGVPVAVEPRTVTVIGRGQVHVFRRAQDVRGGLLRFSDELLAGAGGRIVGGWLLNGGGGRTIHVPDGACGTLDGLFTALAEETERPPDAYSPDVERNLVSTVLLWLERWYDAVRTERRDFDDADVQLHRRFTRLLEDDFARHHDAAHYADALAVPPAALSRTLTELTGRPTKELITDRVMLEAARLLRFTDLSVGEIAFRGGYGDQLYFSRAFKRHFGVAPQGYRERARGA
jgi:AraC family transcriptional regulator, transcriptional activator of pobA